MAIYGINEANKALYHNPIIKGVTALMKKGGNDKARALCRRAYKSIDRAVQNDLKKCPIYEKMYYVTNQKGTGKVKVKFEGGSNESKNIFLNKFADLLNASNLTDNGKIKYSVEDGQLMFHKIK